MGLAYRNSYLVHEYSKNFRDGLLLRDDINAIDVRQATAWHEPSSHTSLDEDAIYDNRHLVQEAHRDPALKDQTRKHLLYAQWVSETDAEPIDPNSVMVLTARLGRTVIRATRRDGGSTIIRILSPEIAMDAFTKVDAYRQQITDAGVAVPETRYGSSLVEWRRYGKPPETQAMGYQVQSFEGDGTTLQDLVDAQPPGPEQQKAYEYVYTQIGRIMLKLQSTSVSIAYPYTRIPYGQYGSAQGGEIAHWGSFSEYLNHMLALQEFAISAMQATELPLGINTKMIKQAMAVVYQDMGDARVLPHIIHGDLRPPNMLANGFVVDWDYAGYGNTWSELVKPCRHIYRNEQALRGLRHGLCSPDGLGLTEEQCNVALRDAETGILLDYLDQLTYTMLSITYEEAETLQHWEEAQQQQQTKLAELRNHKRAIADRIEKLSGLPPEHPDRDYIPDYQFTIRHCDTQIIKTIHAHDLLVKRMHKIRAIQEGIAEMLTPMPKDPYGDPLGWRAARTQPVWQQLDNEKISRKKEARLHDQLTSLRATYPLT